MSRRRAPRLTNLPPELLGRIAHTLSSRDAAALAGSSRDARAGAAPVLAPRKQRHDAWMAALEPMARALRDTSSYGLSQAFSGALGAPVQQFGLTWRRASLAHTFTDRVRGPGGHLLYLHALRYQSVEVPGVYFFVVSLNTVSERAPHATSKLAKRYVHGAGGLIVRAQRAAPTYGDRALAAVLRRMGVNAPAIAMDTAP